MNDDIYGHSGYQMCAALILRRVCGIEAEDSDDGVVSKCIALGFGGDVDKFVEWANLYLSEGCGTAG